MSTVLVRKGRGYVDLRSRWGLWFASGENPLKETQFLHEARTFPTVALARAAKKALGLDRALAARILPDWLA